MKPNGEAAMPDAKEIGCVTSAKPSPAVSSAQLVTGVDVISMNETPVQPDIVELAPYLEIKKASRSSNIYEKFE